MILEANEVEDGRVIIGYPGYLAKPDGTIWRMTITGNYRQVKIEPGLSAAGYNIIRVRHESGITRTVSKGLLVALAFLSDRPYPKAIARHLNGDKSDDSAANLTWGDRSAPHSPVQFKMGASPSKEHRHD